MNPTRDEMVLRASNLSLGYGGREILRDAGFEVRSGQRWFVVGPNGEGKTTLMRGILGLITPTTGQLERNPEQMSPEHIGFVPQRSEINPTLPTTVREFVMLGLVGLSVPRHQRHERLAEALNHVNLEHRIDADYWSLSGGQRQRAALARALIRRPNVLLLDEPTNGLDLPSEDALMQTVMKLNHATGMTTLLVTHNIGLAARFGTHVALVQGGQVLAGPIDDVLKPDILKRAYGVAIEVLQHSEGAVAIRVGEGATP
jgi:manganese/iron transport system ATP-binding protein